ncbi:MAG: apolipoprotein N-acyltransferase [Xenococcaceae cyanobacterium]
MKKIGLALVGGILMGLTPAPVEAWYLAWIALVPLWILILKDEKYNNEKLRIALAWGCGYHGLALFWITGIHPMTWMGVPWLASLAIALFCWLFITLWGAALVVVWSAGMAFLCHYSFLGKGVWLRILIGVTLWSSLEALWSAGPLWWTSLSYTQSPHNLAILQLSQLSGPTTITAAIVAVNGLIAEALTVENQTFKIKKKFLIINFSFLIVLHLIGFWMYTRPVVEPSEAAIKVGIIQGNIPNEIKLSRTGWSRAIEGYTRGYKTLADEGVDAVLTPEGAMPFFQSDLMRSSFISAVQEKGVVAWVGAFGDRGLSYTNSLFTITGTGDIFSRYDKVNLVPLGEYIPFEQFIGGIVERLSPLNEHQLAGEPTQIFETPFGRGIVGICYDSTFAMHFRRQAARGGEFILTSSNNAHYSNTMPAQHHAQDVMRAIETDRWAARATNTGYSAIVDPRGRILWMSGINTYELHADTIYRRQTQTLYVRWGDWLTVVLLVLGISAWLFANLNTHTKSGLTTPFF